MFFWTKWSKCSRNKWVIKDEDWVDSPKWADDLADKIKPLSRAIQWVWDKVDHKIDYVKVDRWDTWSADHTMALVIFPVLKQLKEQKTGHCFIQDEDVPEEMRSDKVPPPEGGGWDDNSEKRFDWVLDEMIWAFEHLVDDKWQENFYSGEHDIQFVPCEDNPMLRQMVHGPNHTFKWDMEGMKKMEDRIDNGLVLFGKYYRGLWT
jgi:hypothetical protein